MTSQPEKKHWLRAKHTCGTKKQISKLKVSFAPKFLSFLSAVWSVHWIIALNEENYQYALVGDRSREYLRFLSRTPQTEESKYQDLVRIAAGKDGDSAKIILIKND